MKLLAVVESAYILVRRFMRTLLYNDLASIQGGMVEFTDRRHRAHVISGLVVGGHIKLRLYLKTG